MLPCANVMDGSQEHFLDATLGSFKEDTIYFTRCEWMKLHDNCLDDCPFGFNTIDDNVEIVLFAHNRISTGGAVKQIRTCWVIHTKLFRVLSQVG